VVNLMRAWRATGSLSPKPVGGRRHGKLDEHSAFLLERVAAKEDITMPELAAELLAASGLSAAPASLSRWLIRRGYRFKKNTAGLRARSARRGREAPRMGEQTPTRDAARSAPACLPG
jgi:transposase